MEKKERSDHEKLIAQLCEDYTCADLTAADRAMLDYANKITKTPCDITSDDIDLLRRTGFDDRAVHDICLITSYYAFVNRIADGLGVELE